MPLAIVQRSEESDRCCEVATYARIGFVVIVMASDSVENVDFGTSCSPKG